MGGLIVLDFIDMKHPRDRQAIYQRMKEGPAAGQAKNPCAAYLPNWGPDGNDAPTPFRKRSTPRYMTIAPIAKGRGKSEEARWTMSVEIQRKLGENPEETSPRRIRLPIGNYRASGDLRRLRN